MMMMMMMMICYCLRIPSRKNKTFLSYCIDIWYYRSEAFAILGCYAE